MNTDDFHTRYADELAGIGPGSCGAHGSARLAFETWITSPPYERDVDRWPADEERYAWPGQYRDITVQVAWEAWQAAQNGEVTVCGKELKP